MDARILKVARRAALLIVLLPASMGAQRRTPNFIVETPDPAFAQQVAQAAEQYRRDLAVEWLGKPMPNWAQPCVLTVQTGPRLGAGGATTFIFERGEVFGWRMSIQGPADRVVDSVLPHEITHTIFACHFRQPLPRWADEGGATSVEHTSEKNKYRQALDQCLRSGRGIAFNRMFAMMEYPSDYMSLYAQGYSLAEYLILAGGRQKYVAFLDDGIKTDDWSGAARRCYGLNDLGAVQTTWLAWVRQGMPQLQRQPAEQIVADARRPRPEPNLIYRIPRESSQPKSQPTASAPLVPVHFPAENNAIANNSPRPFAGEGSGVRATDRVANNAPRTEPKELPASGWHAAGSSAPSESVASSSSHSGDGSSSVYASHPQPVEQPR
jgi:hypothetical protein